MGDLLLKTRVNVTLSNLERVERLPQLLSRRDERVDQFLALPEELQADLSVAWTRVMALTQVVLDAPDIPDELSDLANSLGDVEEGLRATRLKMSAMTRDAKRLREEYAGLTTGRRDLDVFLKKAAGELKMTVNADNYWEHKDDCERVFYEYVDLLRGVALRTIGLHDNTGRVSDLFLLADRLPELWGTLGDWSWQSLAVPSRIEQNESTKASVLRIGFPEWTVWALPLLQHECGHVVVSKHEGSLADPGSVDAAMVADALAMLVTGPAYACAALLLRLDPSQVKVEKDQREHSIETLRSATILATLERSAELADDAELKALAARLRVEWMDGIDAIKRDSSLVTTAQDSRRVRDLVDTAADFLGLSWSGEDPQAPYWAVQWAKIVEWSKLLTAGSSADIHPEMLAPGNGDRPTALAFLLNAAWLARVPADGGPEPDEKALDGLAAATVKSMLALVKPAGKDTTKINSRT